MLKWYVKFRIVGHAKMHEHLYKDYETMICARDRIATDPVIEYVETGTVWITGHENEGE